ncbi:MAG: hypothetical protein RhofKO_12120 [Rhodothermales bacterium]
MDLFSHAADTSSEQAVAFGSSRAAKHKEHCQRHIVQRLHDGMTLAVWPGRARLYKGHRMHSSCYLPAAKTLIADGHVLPVGQTLDQRGVRYALAALVDASLYPVIHDEDAETSTTAPDLDGSTLALVESAASLSPLADDETNLTD